MAAREEGTMLMVYRMTESEEMAQYRDTYGPIMRLTRTEITDYLGNLLEDSKRRPLMCSTNADRL